MVSCLEDYQQTFIFLMLQLLENMLNNGIFPMIFTDFSKNYDSLTTYIVADIWERYTIIKEIYNDLVKD